MFSRRSRKIFFKCMIGNFKLGALPVRRIVDVDPESEIVNPGWRELDMDREKTKRQIAANRDRAGEIEEKMDPEENGDYARALRELESEIASPIRNREDLKIRRKGAPKKAGAGSLEGKDNLRTVRDYENPFLNLIRMIVYRGESKLGTALRPLGCPQP